MTQDGPLCANRWLRMGLATPRRTITWLEGGAWDPRDQPDLPEEEGGWGWSPTTWLMTQALYIMKPQLNSGHGHWAEPAGWWPWEAETSRGHGSFTWGPSLALHRCLWPFLWAPFHYLTSVLSRFPCLVLANYLACEEQWDPSNLLCCESVSEELEPAVVSSVRVVSCRKFLQTVQCGHTPLK